MKRRKKKNTTGILKNTKVDLVVSNSPQMPNVEAAIPHVPRSIKIEVAMNIAAALALILFG